MPFIADSFAEAVRRVVGLDPYVLDAVRISLTCSVLATCFGSLIGLPIGVALGLNRFRGRSAAVVGVNALMATPTVVVGLLVYSFICRRGPLGPLGLLYTPSAIIIGQTLLVAPIVAGLTRSALEQLSPGALKTTATLGIGGLRRAWTLLREARAGTGAAIVTGFARAVGEVGVAMMLGGNILYSTRTVTTAIALETAKGTFELAIALGLILILVAYTANTAFQLLQSNVLVKYG